MNFRERGPQLERSRKIMENEYNIGYISMPDEGDTGLQSFLNIGVRVDRSLRRVDRSCYRLAYLCCFRYFRLGDLLGNFLHDFGTPFSPFSRPFLTLQLPWDFPFNFRSLLSLSLTTSCGCKLQLNFPSTWAAQIKNPISWEVSGSSSPTISMVYNFWI